MTPSGCIGSLGRVEPCDCVSTSRSFGRVGPFSRVGPCGCVGSFGRVLLCGCVSTLGMFGHVGSVGHLIPRVKEPSFAVRHDHWR